MIKIFLIALSKNTINKTVRITKINIPTIIKADSAPVLPSSNVDTNALGISATIPEKMINEILIKNKDKVVEYKSGKEKLFGFFVGQVMKETQGKANPKVVNEILKKKLS